MLGVVVEEAYNTLMPELSRFFGIIIRMYVEANVSHPSSHFHAYYQEHVAIYTIDPVELIAGTLPTASTSLGRSVGRTPSIRTLGGLAAAAKGPQTTTYRATEVRR